MNQLSKRALLLTCLTTSIALLTACGGGGSDNGPSKTGRQQGSNYENLDKEPNDLDHPVELSGIKNLQGSLNASSDQEDVYIFTASQSGNYNVRLSGFGNHDFDLGIVDEESEVLFEGLNNAGEEESGTVSLVAGRVYGILISAEYDPVGSTASYQFTVTLQGSTNGNTDGDKGGKGGNTTTSGDNEPNDSLNDADPITPGQTITGTIDSADDELDFFRLETEEASEYEVVLTGISTDSVDLFLLLADGSQIGTGEVKDNNTLTISFDISGGGNGAPTLYLAVQAANTGSQTESYQLSVSKF